MTNFDITQTKPGKFDKNGYLYLRKNWTIWTSHVLLYIKGFKSDNLIWKCDRSLVQLDKIFYNIAHQYPNTMIISDSACDKELCGIKRFDGKECWKGNEEAPQDITLAYTHGRGQRRTDIKQTFLHDTIDVVVGQPWRRQLAVQVPAPDPESELLGLSTAIWGSVSNVIQK